MNRKYLLIVSGLLLTSCGLNRTEDRVHSDAELVQYALEFERSMDIDSSYISLTFGDLVGHIMGLCTSWSNGKREITIDRGYWAEIDIEAREQVMYHELGHCAMNLNHDDAVLLDTSTNHTIEASIMYPFFFGNDYNWGRYKLAYKQALKNQSHLVL